MPINPNHPVLFIRNTLYFKIWIPVIDEFMLWVQNLLYCSLHCNVSLCSYRKEVKVSLPCLKLLSQLIYCTNSTFIKYIFRKKIRSYWCLSLWKKIANSRKNLVSHRILYTSSKNLDAGKSISRMNPARRLCDISEHKQKVNKVSSWIRHSTRAISITVSQKKGD